MFEMCCIWEMVLIKYIDRNSWKWLKLERKSQQFLRNTVRAKKEEKVWFMILLFLTFCGGVVEVLSTL